jgi:hypothetical protein
MSDKPKGIKEGPPIWMKSCITRRVEIESDCKQ